MSAHEDHGNVSSIRGDAAEVLAAANEVDRLLHEVRDQLQAKVFALDLAMDENFKNAVEQAESEVAPHMEEPDAFKRRLSDLAS